MTVLYFRLLLASLLIIISLIWAWRWMKGVAGSWVLWLVTLSIVGLILVFGPMIWSAMTASHAGRVQGGQTNSGQLTPTIQPKWRWTWETLNGEYVRGLGRQRNAPDETLAEIIPQENGDLYFDVPYVEHGSPQRERVRLGKIGESVWLGDRDQDKPKDHSRVRLEMVVPGVAYAGTITWPYGLVASCKLIRE